MLRREDLPGGHVRLHFEKPILNIDRPQASAEFRPPTPMEVLDLGDPLSWVVGDGAGARVIDRPLLVAWARRLLVDHDLDLIAREPDAALGFMIEEIILDFFTRARKRCEAASATSPASPISQQSGA